MNSRSVVLALTGQESAPRPGPNGVGAAHVDQRSDVMLDGDDDDRGDRRAAHVLAYVLVSAGEQIHVVPASAGSESVRQGPSALSLDTVAALLERAAASLRDGSGRAIHAAAPRHAEPVPRAATAAPERLRLGQLEILPETRLVLRQGDPVPLSRIEFDLFLALVRRAGRPATRLELVREVWGFGAAVTSRSVDTQIYNLRHKLEENPGNPRHLLTVSGVGYRVVP